MIGRLNHVAMVVPSLEEAAERYRRILGARTSDPQSLSDHGVRVVFVDADNTRIELMEPLGTESPVARFLERHPAGGVHHVCFEVPDIEAARDHLVAEGARVLGDGRPGIGAHGRPVLFLHPADMMGALIELEQE